MGKAIVAQQRDYLTKEKASAQAHNMQLPCAITRLAVTPKQLKQKGKTIPAPYPEDPEVIEHCEKVIAGALRRFGVKAVDVSVRNLHDCIIFFEVIISSVRNCATVTGVTEMLDKSFRGTADYDGLRLATQEFIDLDKLNIFRAWPFSRVQAEIETRFGIILSTSMLERVMEPPNESAVVLRQMWEKRAKAAEESQDKNEGVKLEELLALPPKMPAEPLTI